MVKVIVLDEFKSRVEFLFVAGDKLNLLHMVCGFAINEQIVVSLRSTKSLTSQCLRALEIEERNKKYVKNLFKFYKILKYI